MPTYDYTCIVCNEVREIVKPIHNYGDPVFCPKCGERMHRTFSNKAPSAHYKGEGWTGARRAG